MRRIIEFYRHFDKNSYLVTFDKFLNGLVIVGCFFIVGILNAPPRKGVSIHPKGVQIGGTLKDTAPINDANLKIQRAKKGDGG